MPVLRGAFVLIRRLFIGLLLPAAIIVGQGAAARDVSLEPEAGIAAPSGKTFIGDLRTSVVAVKADRTPAPGGKAPPVTALPAEPSLARGRSDAATASSTPSYLGVPAQDVPSSYWSRGPPLPPRSTLNTALN